MPGLIRLIELSSTVTLASQLVVETIRNGAVDEVELVVELPPVEPLDAPPAADAPPAPDAPVELLDEPDEPDDAEPEVVPDTESPTATPTVATRPVTGDLSTAAASAIRAVTTSARAVTTCA